MGLVASHSLSKDVTSLTATTASDSAAAPNFVCDPGVTCAASWAYFNPGQRCLSLYPIDLAGQCTRVDESLHPVPHEPGVFDGCEWSLAGSLVTDWVPWLGEVTIAGATFSCAWSAFGALVNG
nr:hypothetical protein [Ferrimicrobium acidiphilum]